MGREHWQQAELGGRQGRDAPGRTNCGHRDSSARRSAACPAKIPRPGRRVSTSVDLPKEDPRRHDVGQRKVAPGELDPGLDGQVRHSVGQGRPKALRPGQLRQGTRPVGLVQCYPGGHRMHDRDGRIVRQVGLTGQRPGLGQVPLGCLPIPPGDRQQRPLRQRHADTDGWAARMTSGGHVLEEDIGPASITGHQIRHPQVQRHRVPPETARGHRPGSEFRVGPHLLGAVAAHQRPHQRPATAGSRRSRPASWPGGCPLGGLGPAFGLTRLPGQGGDHRGQDGGRRLLRDQPRGL